jgi:hypothetical protein
MSSRCSPVNPAPVGRMWPTPGTFSVLPMLWKNSIPARSSRSSPPDVANTASNTFLFC